MKLDIQQIFTSELPGDPIMINTRRQVKSACYSSVRPTLPTDPSLIHASEVMAEAIGLSSNDLPSEEFLNTFSGKSVLPDSVPYAMCYGGHQFGHWAGQLGDGRAINLGQVTHDSKTWTLQLKGSGETPYSRSADGMAVLRSSIREYLCSEAMHYLGVPTTRALSLMLTGDEVIRDMLYDGNTAYEKGAIVCRVAPSFLRFGNFEIFAARKDPESLRTLIDYTIRHHFSHLGQPNKETYLELFREITQRTLKMIIHWQRVGFVHGVMNTDNLSILGLTIDYGPYGWLEGYDPGWTPNTTDRQHKRYRYGNQAYIGLWNLAQLANAFHAVVGEAEPLQEILDSYRSDYQSQWLDMHRSKLGLTTQANDDQTLIASLLELLQVVETDMTIFFRLLGQLEKENSDAAINIVKKAIYSQDDLSAELTERWNQWMQSYAERLNLESQSDVDRRKSMNRVNPKYVLRNYMAQLAIDDADKGNYALINELYTMLQQPYEEQPEYERWFAKRPEWARHKVGCSMLSCSS